MTQIGEVTGVGNNFNYYTIIHPKPPAHIMLTLMNVEQGLGVGFQDQQIQSMCCK